MPGAADRANYEGISAEWLNEHGAEAAARFTEQGLLRINGLVDAMTCHALRLHVDGCLVEARAAAGEGADSPDVFGDVHAGEHRWDMYLALEAPVLLMLREATTKLFPALVELISDEMQVCELSSLISDSGSARQPLHSDTTWQVGLPPLITCFIALQDISDDMGPTIMLPHSASVACHDEWQRSVGVSEQGLADLLRGPTTAVGSLTMPVVRCAISAGDVVLMDSRLLHCAGANLAGPRRRLLYFTVVDGGGKPLPEDAMSSMSRNVPRQAAAGQP